MHFMDIVGQSMSNGDVLTKTQRLPLTINAAASKTVGKLGQMKKTLLIMKFTAIFLLAACLQVSARGFGQRISLVT
ncbi:MAG: hypothetical protein ABI687_03490, partial [Flavitalea sp.]